MSTEFCLIRRLARAGRLAVGAVFISSAWANAALAGDISGGASGLYADVPGATGMTIAGPRGFAATVKSDYYMPEQTLPNGSYRYEIYGRVPVVDDALDSKRSMNNGRDPGSAKRREKWGTGVIASGHFRIRNGRVFEPGNEKEE